MGFKSCIADPDVWRRPATKSNGDKYYEYIMTYVDDVIAISIDAKKILREVQSIESGMQFKNDKIEPPTVYLGAKLTSKVMDGIQRWTISSDNYVKAAVSNIEDLVKNNPKYRIDRNQKTPMVGNYLPELDGSTELESDEVTLYQELIGVLRWATEIGRVDILHEVSILSQYQASPRQGHLEQVFNIFGYLKHNPKLSLHMDPSLPDIDYSTFDFEINSFFEQYRDAEELLPPDRPEQRGIAVVTTAYVDASHAANRSLSSSSCTILLARLSMMEYACLSSFSNLSQNMVGGFSPL